ncbi:MAG: hypothetical protein J07HQW2_00791 [Haloquadratum walsbyi J07HQW2]|jgi:hypothetical protein|uniref:Uncharacterized protein n=1 Tax=Haloquadratum walsbyi J07HQW2 TaxID=1238425 RepID=U1PL01_9EURY|nr:MAG: hypothetical protein J07HQW2_00791 [Haloquadratum walsbyi J07HQW2]
MDNHSADERLRAMLSGEDPRDKKQNHLDNCIEQRYFVCCHAEDEHTVESEQNYKIRYA